MDSRYNEDVYESSEMDDDDIKVVPATIDLLEEERASKHDVFKTPTRLIYTDDKGLLSIDNDVLSQLSQIKKKISVAGTCELYRRGKSYLAGEKTGFTLGNTVQSETKGIWVWCKNHPKNEDEVLVFVETEGLDDPEKGDPDHDNNLFCLTLLISSTLIIHVEGFVDHDTLDKLACIGTMAKSKKHLDGEEADRKNTHMVSVAPPMLVMCISDFFLDNVKDGKHYTPDEYLEEKLKPIPKPSQIKFNKTKKAFTTYFPKRKCFTLAQPASGNALQKTELFDDDAIEKTCRQDQEALKKYIYERKPQYICNASKTQIDGADLAALISSNVKAFRGNTKAAKKRNERVLKKVMKKEMKEGEKMTQKQQDLFLGVFERSLAKYREKSLPYLLDEFDDLKIDLLEEERTSKHDLFETPMLLIYEDDKGQLEIDNSVLFELSQIYKKVIVVGICGLHRSGKSYLMNRIAGERRGFTLGNTVQSKRKGIWVWCKNHPNHEDEVLVLIDTEGLNDPEKGDLDLDNKLYCLTLLISSTLIINVKGVVAYDTLDKLAFIGTIADSVKIVDGEEADRKNTHIVSVAPPTLVMCVRDFFLENVKDGKHYTPDEYLEENLKPVVQPKPRQTKFNLTKKAITTYFPKRKCFTLAQPATGNALQKLELLDDDAIDQKFLQDLEALKKYIYKRKPKYICNGSKKTIDGADLATLISSYVNALRGNTPIQCEDAYAQASKQRNERVLEKVMKDFKKKMKDGEKMTKKQKLQDMFLGAFEKTLSKYRDGSFIYLQDDFEERAKGQMISHHELMQQELKARCQELGAKKLFKMYDTMIEKNKDIYSSSDGYECYNRDMVALQKQFFEDMKEYDKDDLCEAFEELKKSKKHEKMEFYRAASEVKPQQNLSSVQDDIRKEIDATNQLTLDRERQKMDENSQGQFELLRAKHNELYDLIINSNKKNSLCSIM